MRALILVMALIATPALASLEKAGEAFDRADFAEAARLLLPLAEAGDVRAQMNLGGLYSDGLGVPKDLVKGAAWTFRAAESGNAKAQANMGLLFLRGKGVPEDAQQAAAWLKRAAIQNNAGAQNSLGTLYVDGRGVSKDYKLAEELFRAAMRGGEFGAANNLARMVEQGLVRSADLSVALKLYAMAAAGGDPAAQNRIGLAYRDGEQRPKSDITARDWFEKAASQGEKYGQYHYGLMLIADKATDPAQALMWIALSARQGHLPAKAELNARLPELDSAQQKRWKQLVISWVPTGRGVFDPPVHSVVSGATSPGKPVDERWVKARLLYGCALFFGAGAKSSDEAHNAKLTRISDRFLASASPVVADISGSEPSTMEQIQKIARSLGESDLKAFMRTAADVSTESGQNVKLDQFARSCAAAIGVVL